MELENGVDMVTGSPPDAAAMNQPTKESNPPEQPADGQNPDSSMDMDVTEVAQNSDQIADTSGCPKDDFVFAVPSAPAPRSRPPPATTDDDELLPLTLDTLPAELFLHICSFLDAKFVIHTLSLVCHYFHGLIHDNTFWKVRIAKRWPKKYPAIPGEWIQWRAWVILL